VSFISRDSPGKWYSFKSVNEGQPIYISNHFTWQKWNDKIHNESINYTPLKERHFLYYTFFFTSTKKAFCLCVEVKERERDRLFHYSQIDAHKNFPGGFDGHKCGCEISIRRGVVDGSVREPAPR